MVLSFFRRPEPGLGHIASQVSTMLDDARHSFELATDAVVADAPYESASAEIEVIDDRINQTEYELRRELVVHVAVRGSLDIAQVLGFTLLTKRIERLGDQAKNILDLAAEGVSLAGADDVDEYVGARHAISALFAETAAFVLDPSDGEAAEIRGRAAVLHEVHDRRIRELLHADEPGRWAVPRAILHRYLKRIVANLSGIANTLTEPVPTEMPGSPR